MIGAVAAGAAAGLGRAVGGAPSPGVGGTSALSPTGPSARVGNHLDDRARGGDDDHGARRGGHDHRAGRRRARGSVWPARCPSAARRPSWTRATGDPGLVLQLTKDQFVAYDAVCPHAGCTVGYSAGAKLIVCPRHGSEFDPATGAVVNPPAQRGLTPIHVEVAADGSLLADG